MGGKQKNKTTTISTTTKKQPLKESKGRTTLVPTWLQIAATQRPHDLR